jgi:hypothetical protein
MNYFGCCVANKLCREKKKTRRPVKKLSQYFGSKMMVVWIRVGSIGDGEN